MTTTTSGRPRAELTASQRRDLERATKRVRSAEERLEAARLELAYVTERVRDEGASLRAIGEIIGLSKVAVRSLAERAT